MDTFWQDLKFGFRMWKSRPGFTLAAILCLTLGIGATTGMVLMLNLQHTPGQLEAAARVLERSPGTCPVFVYFQDGAGKWLKLKAADCRAVVHGTSPTSWRHASRPTRGAT